MGASIGFLFESHANRQLSAGVKFRMRSLDDKIETEIELSPRTSQIFQDISECTNPNIYYIAEQNFPCIDSLIVGVGYFQITISSKHDIKKNQMKGIKNKPNMKMKKFYFVVPDTHYEAFKKQRLTEDKKEEKTSKVTSKSSLEDLTSNMEISEEIGGTNKENEAQLMNVDSEEGSEELVQQFVIAIPITTDMKGWLDQLEQSLPIVQKDGGEEGRMDEEIEKEIVKMAEIPDGSLWKECIRSE